MSVAKLISRIVASSTFSADEDAVESDTASMLHDHTYGIASDPLTQFSCIFAALIHDVDHAGVPNAQLAREGGEVSRRYRNKSVAEQNSVHLAWNLLFEDRYNELRAAVYATDDELLRFRQIVVNAVMATDIVDKDLKALRNARWDRAFASTSEAENDPDAVHRKATIVIEHLLQASDVSHTMQHWHIYRQWNERYFLECHQAYRDGRAECDPLEGWYAGELAFFDFYIIPLAKKLKSCGVFGVCSAEYLNYAVQNRREWESRGRDLVHELKMLVPSSAGGGIVN
jgi:3'5'-cyclic nucleotide phosphodiesterase